MSDNSNMAESSHLQTREYLAYLEHRMANVTFFGKKAELRKNLDSGKKISHISDIYETSSNVIK